MSPKKKVSPLGIDLTNLRKKIPRQVSMTCHEATNARRPTDMPFACGTHLRDRLRGGAASLGRRQQKGAPLAQQTLPLHGQSSCLWVLILIGFPRSGGVGRTRR